MLASEKMQNTEASQLHKSIRTRGTGLGTHRHNDVPAQTNSSHRGVTAPPEHSHRGLTAGHHQPSVDEPARRCRTPRRHSSTRAYAQSASQQGHHHPSDGVLVTKEWVNHRSVTFQQLYVRIGSRKTHIDMMMCLLQLVRVSEGMLESL